MYVKVNGELKESYVDLEDFEHLKGYSWHTDWRKCRRTYYVKRTDRFTGADGKRKGRTIRLHNYLINPPEGMFVDHINNNTLDNRRSNLRLVCKSKNAKNRYGKNSNNTSGYRNVSWNKDSKKWVVQLQVDGTNKILGQFNDVHEAGKFADEMRNIYYGEYAGGDEAQ